MLQTQGQKERQKKYTKRLYNRSVIAVLFFPFTLSKTSRTHYGVERLPDTSCLKHFVPSLKILRAKS